MLWNNISVKSGFTQPLQLWGSHEILIFKFLAAKGVSRRMEILRTYFMNHPLLLSGGFKITNPYQAVVQEIFNVEIYSDKMINFAK